MFHTFSINRSGLYRGQSGTCTLCLWRQSISTSSDVFLQKPRTFQKNRYPLMAPLPSEMQRLFAPLSDKGLGSLSNLWYIEPSIQIVQNKAETWTHLTTVHMLTSFCPSEVRSCLEKSAEILNRVEIWFPAHGIQVWGEISGCSCRLCWVTTFNQGTLVPMLLTGFSGSAAWGQWMRMSNLSNSDFWSWSYMHWN